MITVITSKGDTPDALFSARFGRADWFCVYHEDTGETRFVKNETLDNPGHVGPGAAQQVIRLGATKVISGDFGPRVSYRLEKSDIQMVMIRDDNYTVGDIISKLKK